MTSAVQSVGSQALQRRASAVQIWILAVAAVISGEFFGWNYGLKNGFWSLFIALIMATVLYTGLLLVVLEMGSIFPQTGAAYVFAYQAMGPLGGFLSGLAEYMEYQMLSTTTVVGVGRMLHEIIPHVSEPIWWAVCYAFFSVVDLYGVHLSLRVLAGVLMLALGTMIVFYVSAIPRVDVGKWLGVSEGESAFPSGWLGVLASMPYAMWFYLAVEAVPLATEETKNPGVSLPAGGLVGLATLTALAFVTLVVNSGVKPGPNALIDSPAPLSTALEPIWGKGWALDIFTFCGLAGLLASFQAAIYATGRQVYSGSQAGFFPKFLSLTSNKKTPYVAVIATSCIGWLLALVVYGLGESSLAASVLLNMCTLGALLSYASQLISFLLLRRAAPNLVRPFRNPLGIWGATLALIISIITFLSLFLVPENRWAMIGVVLWYLAGIMYFFFYSRHHLTGSQKPENPSPLRSYEPIETVEDCQEHQSFSQQASPL